MFVVDGFEPDHIGLLQMMCKMKGKFQVDRISPPMYAQLGQDKIKEISTNFYNRVYAEDVEDVNSPHHSYFGKFFVRTSKGK